MRVGITEEFVGELRGGVGRDRPAFDLLFGKRGFACSSVNGTGRAENEFLDAQLAAYLEQTDGCRDVHAVIKNWFVNRWTYAGASCQMDDSVRTNASEEYAHFFNVADVLSDKLELPDAAN